MLERPNNQQQIVSVLSQMMPEMKDRFSVSSLSLFGSFARDEQSDASDIDLLVEFDRPVGWAFFELKDTLEDALNRRVDITTRTALKDELRESVLNEAIPVD